MLHWLVDHWHSIFGGVIAAAFVVLLFKLVAALGGSHSGADWRD